MRYRGLNLNLKYYEGVNIKKICIFAKDLLHRIKNIKSKGVQAGGLLLFITMKLKKGQEIYVIKLHKKPEIIKCNIIKLGRLYFNVDKLSVTTFFEINTGLDKYSNCGHNHSYKFFTSEKEVRDYILKKELVQKIKYFKSFESLNLDQLRTINEIINFYTLPNKSS